MGLAAGPGHRGRTHERTRFAGRTEALHEKKRGRSFNLPKRGCVLFIYRR
jgi:hypothetical protein